jgi:hypothetical protein
MTGKIQITQPKGAPTPPNMWDDFKWSGENRIALFNQYGSCVALVYQRRVIGTGKSIEDAVADAEQRLPTDSDEVTPIIRFLHGPRMPITVRRRSEA